MAGFDRDRHDIEGILHTVKLTRSAAQNVRDLIAGYGEIWSTKLFREFFATRGKRFGEVQWIDAREAVVVEWGPLGPAVQWDESRAKLRALVPASFQGTLIITGFIASDRRGVQTTLGRNGSDFSGSIFGSLLDAAEIHIWTDVDGVLSADPRRVPDAKVIDALSYNEAMELAYFGAKVIHPQTMAPAVGRGIPIWIRNTFAPDKQGSLICAQPNSKLPVKGITSIENIAMINVEGAGMSSEAVFTATPCTKVARLPEVGPASGVLPVSAGTTQNDLRRNTDYFGCDLSDNCRYPLAHVAPQRW